MKPLVWKDEWITREYKDGRPPPKVLKRIIDGVPFTFECNRCHYITSEGKKAYIVTWWWGPDLHTFKHVAIGSKKSIYPNIEREVRVGKYLARKNNR
jgi:hypothetical protein